MEQRWRCAGCGNLTRFDVVRDARTSEYWHFDLAGAPTVEESHELAASLVSVTCRWCGRADAIELVARPAHDEEGALRGDVAVADSGRAKSSPGAR